MQLQIIMQVGFKNMIWFCG